MGLTVAAYLLLVLVVVPVISRRTAAGGLLTTLPRPTLYRSSMATAWTLTLIGAVVLVMAPELTVPKVRLIGLSPVGFLTHLGITLAGLAAATLFTALLRKMLRRPESRDVLYLVPRTGHERRLFWGVSVTAGLTEEFVFRGIALTALAGVLPVSDDLAPWAAAAIVAVAFGFGHGYQDGLGMLRAGFLGFLLAVPAILTGSLLPGMAAHTLFDLTLITRLGRTLVGTAGDAPSDEQQPEGIPL